MPSGVRAAVVQPTRRSRPQPFRRERPTSGRDRPRLVRTASYNIDCSSDCAVVAENTDTYAGDLARRAERLDQELMQLAYDDGAARRVLGRLSCRFIEVRGCQRLGFARVGDYAAERLGWSGRQLHETARVASALARLPLIERALRGQALGWSKARLLTSIATPTDEEKWLGVAATITAEALASVTSSARAAAREERGLGASRELRAGSSNEISEFASRSDTAPAVDEEDDEDDEERVLLRLQCSKRGIRLWNAARRLAPRMAGRALTQAKVANLVAAEASSAPGPFHDQWQQEPWRSLASIEACTPKSRTGSHADGKPDRAPTNGSSSIAEARESHRRPPDSDGSGEIASALECELDGIEDLDAFGLDAAMRRVRRAMQQRQSRLGVALGLFLGLRLPAQLGYACGTDYVRERLGMSDRTARELVRVAEAVQAKSPELASAYAAGELSWLRVLALLPVVRACNAAAWVKRAREVTLRRLADEVAWASERIDVAPEFSAAVPPAPGRDLGNDNRQNCARCKGGDQVATSDSGDDRQICAHARSGDQTTDVARDVPDNPRDQLWGVLGRIHVTFTAPRSVSVLFRSAMQSFASPAEPRWKAFERMLEQVLGEWRRQPRHRDPVFARDGYRCTAPACSSFTNLHDHHIVPRSGGGTNDLGNRTTLCAWHHLHGVHGGLARATGQAPDAVDWELGLAGDKPPLMHLRGDRYYGTTM